MTRPLRADEDHNHAAGDESAKSYQLEPCTGVELDISSLHAARPLELKDRELDAVQLVSDSGVFQARIVNPDTVLLDHTTLEPMRDGDFLGFGKGQRWAIAVGVMIPGEPRGGLNVAWASIIEISGP
ncbi:MAG: hypothetical protein KC933_06970 [Myxococcales bacterium]|nr:hypothetical protein [Myxococcales bacterium]MCB9651290.1 hypothetical protein [Deltaproteobacteria bacterium]